MGTALRKKLDKALSGEPESRCLLHIAALPATAEKVAMLVLGQKMRGDGEPLDRDAYEAVMDDLHDGVLKGSDDALALVQQLANDVEDALERFVALKREEA